MGGVVWIASYPRSGNTWIRAFLHSLLNITGGKEEFDLNSLAERSDIAAHRYLQKSPDQVTKEAVAAARPLAQQRSPTAWTASCSLRHMRLQRPRNSDDRHDADGERHLLRPQSARRCHLVHAIAVEKLCKRANAIGKFILDRCRDLQDNSNLNCIGDVRGLGAMCAVKLVKSAASGEPTRELTSMLMKIANEKGLILLSCGAYGNVIRFLVPLTASDALVKEGMDIFAASLAEAVNRAPL